MSRELIRLWVEEDIEQLAKQLLIVGESYSDCGNCRQLGLDFSVAKSCPQCKTLFKYVTSRQASGSSGDRFHWLKKIKGKRPELHFVDYDDYQKNIGRLRARDLLK